MKVAELVQELALEVLNGADLGENISGCYIGDLLSLVMSRAQQGQAWLTVQTNLNIIAVAVLTEVSCVIVVEQMEVGEETIAKAREQGVTLLRSPLPAYELTLALSTLLNQK